MIDALIAAHPRGMDRANLADRAGMTATGGTFQTYLSRLKSNGVIEVAGRKIMRERDGIRLVILTNPTPNTRREKRYPTDISGQAQEKISLQYRVDIYLSATI